MEKMEHMDPQRCDRIWQRVSPELDPYPEVRAACREPSREPGAENIPERTGAAAVPAAPEIPAVPAESGCCLAGRAMGSIRLIQDFIEDELADRRAYLAYAACAPNMAARRLLRQLAGEEGSHARRLMGVYYLVTGVQSDGITVLEIGYSLGLMAGVLVFFNHFVKRKLTTDPTPIEVQMRLYEDEVDTTVIQNAARKESGVDVR